MLSHSLDAKHRRGADVPPDEEPWGVQLLLGHSKLESTVRYLGVEVDDALGYLRTD